MCAVSSRFDDNLKIRFLHIFAVFHTSFGLKRSIICRFVLFSCPLFILLSTAFSQNQIQGSDGKAFLKIQGKPRTLHWSSGCLGMYETKALLTSRFYVKKLRAQGAADSRHQFLQLHYLRSKRPTAEKNYKREIPHHVRCQCLKSKSKGASGSFVPVTSAIKVMHLSCT